MLKSKGVCLAKGASRIRWEVEQDNVGAIKFYQRLGANCEIKAFFDGTLHQRFNVEILSFFAYCSL